MRQATAGSGDVINGMITSLLAQGYEPVDAAILCLSPRTLLILLFLKQESVFIASDIISNIGRAFLTLRSN
jgi:NAD(P)H-hydrate repair Nnr-like enzyme with NAD(P)H-hydrate dehydratase domain